MVLSGTGATVWPSGEVSVSGFMDSAPATVSPLSAALKKRLTSIISWADANSPRSLQVAIGPSELGTSCQRRLAYRLAGWREVNEHMDPWPAIVGTAVHAWTGESVQKFMTRTGAHDWLIEVELHPDPLVTGHSDLYQISTGTVVDLKTCGVTALRHLQKHGPSHEYKVQVHTYGLGHQRAGRPVNSVALVFVPRAGWLRDMYVWSEPYDERVALTALGRMYDLAYRLIEMDVQRYPSRFSEITATPGDACVFCPFYNPTPDQSVTADHLGCPGR